MKKTGWIAVIFGAIIGVLVVLFEVFAGVRRPGGTADTPDKIIDDMEKQDTEINNLNKQAEDLDAQRKKLVDDIRAGRVPPST